HALVPPTQPPANAAPPDRALTRTMNGIDVVLRHPVACGEVLNSHRTTAGEMDMLEAAALKTEPHVVAGSGDRVDHVRCDAAVTQTADVSVAQPEQSAAGRREPRPIASHEHRARFQRDVLLCGVGSKCSVTPAFDPGRRADPQI